MKTAAKNVMPPRIPATTESTRVGLPMPPELSPFGRPVEVIDGLIEVGVEVVNIIEAESPDAVKLSGPGKLVDKGTSAVDLGAIAVVKFGGSTEYEFPESSDYETVERGGVPLSG